MRTSQKGSRNDDFARIVPKIVPAWDSFGTRRTRTGRIPKGRFFPVWGVIGLSHNSRY
jgi:hypothetical protein